MSLKVYNSLSRNKELFEPLEPGKVKFYTCGVTVYDYCHIGHARAYTVFDVIRRYLEFRGFDVTYVQNFTDIDDKIIARANERGMDIYELTQQFIDAYFVDMEALYIRKADCYPKATEYIPIMQIMIKKLIDDGRAYALDGDVYYSVETFEGYGKLSGKILEDLVAGKRVDVSDKKKSPLDFVLWKASKPGEPKWASPWGEGRPGWHIECSAMTYDQLGVTIDIHAGGEDLIFPHHENEIAQSEGFSGKPFVKYWLHNGFVNIKEEKMSKSKNNFYTIRDVLKDYDGEVIRFFLMKVHYRSPLNFSFEGLDEAKQALERLYTPLREYYGKEEPLNSEAQMSLKAFEKRFFEAMDDDFNFTEAIGILFEICRLVNKTGNGAEVLFKLGQIIGLFNQPLQLEASFSDEILDLVEQRKEAKAQKDYQRSDQIRDVLLHKHKIEIQDTPEGVKIKQL
jgi:cysteinyl-tRNA synthetase